MRLFTGLSIPQPVLETLTQVLDGLRPVARLNWSPPKNLHVTLKFIGSWADERLPELRETLSAIPKPGSFAVEISRFGFFPNPNLPNHFFAGVHAGTELGALAHSIDEALATLGCPREPRPYTPHLTLARIKGEDIRSLREHIASMINLHFGTFEATDFHLYLSRPGSRGSAYTILSSFPLAAGAAA
jgi:2'-5' RNA ligase